MTTFEEAHAKVERLLNGIGKRLNVELAIDEGATRTETWSWVFFYNSATYLKTGAFSHALAGNGPLVVERGSGEIHQLTTARPLAEQLEELYRAINDGEDQ